MKTQITIALEGESVSVTLVSETSNQPLGTCMAYFKEPKSKRCYRLNMLLPHTNEELNIVIRHALFSSQAIQIHGDEFKRVVRDGMDA
ncbi:MAG: hypothetical protein JKY54_10835 [Flavobacteriales bacterium]|nr:hypothetical protein [Flavobacteriales bacterium]